MAGLRDSSHLVLDGGVRGCGKAQKGQPLAFGSVAGLFIGPSLFVLSPPGEGYVCIVFGTRGIHQKWRLWRRLGVLRLLFSVHFFSRVLKSLEGCLRFPEGRLGFAWGLCLNSVDGLVDGTRSDLDPGESLEWEPMGKR